MNPARHLSSVSDQLALFADEEYKPVEIDTVYQYLLVLSPPDEHLDKIKRLKYDLNHLAYLGSYNLFSIPHITLARMQSVHRQLGSFGRPLQKNLAGHGPLQVALNGFNYLERGKDLRTLYLHIEEPEPISAIHDQLHASLGIPLQPYIPHLSIAKEISSVSFQELWAQLPPQGYRDVFVCDHVVVLERTIRNQKVSHYKPVKKLKLG